MLVKTIRNGEIAIVEEPDPPVIEEVSPPEEPTAEERIAALEETNAMLTECILELSELLYN